MTCRLALALAGAWIGAVMMLHAEAPRRSRPVSNQRSAAAAPARAEYEATIERYCVTCHNERLKTGGLTLDPDSLRDVAARGDQFERVIRKLRAGLMPPAGAPRPGDDGLNGLAGWLEGELDRAAAVSPNPGRPMLHRLNRTEYANAIRDLLHLDVDPSTLLPPDDSAYGFDNVADVLGVSPSLQERYLAAASRISALAVGDIAIRPSGETYRVRQDLSQDQHHRGSAPGNDRRPPRAAFLSGRRRVRLPDPSLSYESEQRSRPRVP
jgi:mono/diheme cytochrome c family protein